MSNTSTKDTIKTICQGALGAMTFGAYHQFTTNRIIELNNQNQDLKQQLTLDKMESKQQYMMDKLQATHSKEIAEMKSHIRRLEDQRRWWFF
jgi:hypothetical protein